MYRHGPAALEVSYRRQRDGRFAIDVNGLGLAETPHMTASVRCADAGWIDIEEGGHRYRRHVFRHGHRAWVQGPAGDVALVAVPRFPEAERETVAGGLAAPMPGTVLAVHVHPGDPVSTGQLLMIVEAMKMEHRITAPRPGVVGEVRAQRGDQVAAGDVMVVIEEAQ